MNIKRINWDKYIKLAAIVIVGPPTLNLIIGTDIFDDIFDLKKSTIKSLKHLISSIQFFLVVLLAISGVRDYFKDQ